MVGLMRHIFNTPPKKKKKKKKNTQQKRNKNKTKRIFKLILIHSENVFLHFFVAVVKSMRVFINIDLNREDINL